MLPAINSVRKMCFLMSLMIAAISMLAVHPPASAEQLYFSVQAHTFQSEDHAKQAVSDLETMGMNAFVRREFVPGGDVRYRVFVGRFTSREEAERLAETLKVEGIAPEAVLRPLVAEQGPTPGAGAVRRPDSAGSPGPAVSTQAIDAPDSGPAAAYTPIPTGSPAWGDEHVSSFKSAIEADAEVRRLAEQGRSAYVHETRVLGLRWFRVYVRGSGPDTRLSGQRPISTPASPETPPPPAASAGPRATETYTSKPASGFEIIFDLSGSVEKYSGCQGRSSFETGLEILTRFNQSLPAGRYAAALRVFGYKTAWSRSDYTRLAWGPAVYDRASFASSIQALRPSSGISPLGYAVAASSEELARMNGVRALIIISDFRKSTDFGEPMKRALELRARFGPDLCLHTIYTSGYDDGLELAISMPVRVGCGFFWNGCRLLSDPMYFRQMMGRILGGIAVPRDAVGACPDSDLDGVCDELDACPGTPAGAPVDERGCWIAAFNQYFDTNRAEIKDQFLPRIKEAADILKASPGLTVIVAGHTDNTGSRKYNLDLGRKRALAVRDALRRFGVTEGRVRLLVKSYGESRPIADNRTTAGRARNRRVELHISTTPGY